MMLMCVARTRTHKLHTHTHMHTHTLHTHTLPPEYQTAPTSPSAKHVFERWNVRRWRRFPLIFEPFPHVPTRGALYRPYLNVNNVILFDLLLFSAFHPAQVIVDPSVIFLRNSVMPTIPTSYTYRHAYTHLYFISIRTLCIQTLYSFSTGKSCVQTYSIYMYQDCVNFTLSDTAIRFLKIFLQRFFPVTRGRV